MAEKIFISYNHKDKILVDTIARRLELEFGRNNIFYDAWSMQPGDSIIGKMDIGLEEFTTFFFFVSKNSLASKMVTLEWQTALNRALNEKLKFIAVRIADCSVPIILSDKLYIDLYGEGLDDAIEKMKKVIKSESTYMPLKELQNIQGTYRMIDCGKCRITIRATTYSENNPVFAVACENSFDDFSACFNITEGMTITGRDELRVDVGLSLNAYTVQLQRPLKPGFPFVFEVSSNEGKELHNLTVYVLKDAEKRIYCRVPIKNE